MIPYGKDESIRVVATLKNHGGTTSELSIKFPDETGDMENNHDNSSRALAKKNKVNLHKQIFDIKPRKFKVEPGEFIDIEIFYNPRDVNEHELVLKAVLTNGKPFNILLKGETIDKNVGVLSPLIGDNCLFPTPINISFPVTNQVMFKNAGNLKIK